MIVMEKEIEGARVKEVMEEVIRIFDAGHLIPHEWLKKRFEIKRLRFDTFGNEREYDRARDKQEFDYLFYIDELREGLLESRTGYLKNIRGDGYMILPANEQVRYGIKRFKRNIEKIIRKTDPIINKVPPVSTAQQARDNDLRARYSALKQMLIHKKNELR